MAPVTNPKPKPKFKWEPEDMAKAIAAVKAGMAPFTASRQYNVPRATLLLRLKAKEPLKRKMGPECTLGIENELLLVNWIKGLTDKGYPVTARGLTASVEKIVKEMEISNKFKNDRPGKKWYQLFMNRHNLSERIVEKLTSSRSLVTEEKIRKWFKTIDDYIRKDSKLQDAIRDPRRVFNIDESGFLLCPKGEKVITIKGTKNVYEVCSNNEKEQITVLLAASAAGIFAPSLVVYPGQRFPKGLENYLPDGWAPAKTEKGWITSESFYEYIANVFHKWLLKNDIPLPVILFVDGHSSHLTLHLSEFGAANGIEIMALCPNATHILQPLDVSVFGPLKKKYAQRVKEWKIENDCLVLDKVKLPMVLNGVLKDLDASVIANGFRTSGLYPLSADNVNYTRCVTASTDHIEKEAIDPRHAHLEKLLDPELVALFKDGKGQESPFQPLWLKSRQICSGAPGMTSPAQVCIETDSRAHSPSQTPSEHAGVTSLAQVCMETDSRVHSPSQTPSEHAGMASPVQVCMETDSRVHSPSSTPSEHAGMASPVQVCMETDSRAHSPSPTPSEHAAMAYPSTSTSTSTQLEKVLSPDGAIVPSPIKRALFWPGTPTKKKKARRALHIPVITSEEFRKIKTKQKQMKADAEKLKEENKLKREELKKIREIKKQDALKRKAEKQTKKTRKEKKSETESSDSDAEVTSGESIWVEEDSNDGAPHWEPVIRKEGEYVVVKYDGKFFPGKIKEVQEKGALVTTMEPSGRLWKWPANEDVLLYEWEDIVSHCIPTQTSKTRLLFNVKNLEFQHQYVV